MAKRVLRVADLSNDDAQAESQLTDAQEQEAADAAAIAASPTFAVVPNAPKSPRNRIAEIAEAAERKSREVPVVDRLGKPPKEERVAKATAPKVVKEPKAKVVKELPLCQCGCGERTGGGKFLPGHDAKLKSRLFTEARSEDDTLRTNALQQLSERNWLHLMGEKKVAKPKQAPVRTPITDVADLIEAIGEVCQRTDSGSVAIAAFLDSITDAASELIGNEVAAATA